LGEIGRLACERGVNRRGKEVKRCRESGKNSKEEFFYTIKERERKRMSVCMYVQRREEEERVCEERRETRSATYYLSEYDTPRWIRIFLFLFFNLLFFISLSITILKIKINY